MKYTAENFTNDIDVVAYINNPLEALHKLNKLHGKIKKIVEKDYMYRLGKVYREKKGKNYYIVYPIFGEDETGDILWKTIEDDVSFEMYQVVEDAGLGDIWAFEGQRKADSGVEGVDDLIEVIFYLK